jgi:hypothetical protein
MVIGFVISAVVTTGLVVATTVVTTVTSVVIHVAGAAIRMSYNYAHRRYAPDPLNVAEALSEPQLSLPPPPAPTDLPVPLIPPLSKEVPD